MDNLSEIKNREIADILYEIADLLEIKGVQFKPEHTEGPRKQSRRFQKMSKRSMREVSYRKFRE